MGLLLSEVFLQLVFSIIFSVETVTSALRYFLKDVGHNMPERSFRLLCHQLFGVLAEGE